MKKKSKLAVKTEIKWAIMPTAYSKTSSETMLVGFYPKKAGGQEINHVRIRMGKKILDQLHWETGDKICIYYDPDNLMSLCLVKTVSGSGVTLLKETGQETARLQFTWTHKVPLEFAPYHGVDFEISKKQLLLTLN